MRSWRSVALAAVFAGTLLAVAGGCAPRPPGGQPEPEKPAARLTLEPASFADIEGWAEDDHLGAAQALARSCGKLSGLPSDRPLGMAGTVGEWAAPCAALATLPGDDRNAARGFFETWFVPWAAGDNGEREGLFTGYYEPELRGSLEESARYRVPLHRRPADLVMVDLGEFRENLKGERIAGRVVDGRLRPFEDRARIEAGALYGKELELLWVDDPVDAFFLQIQGSGRVVLEDGRVVRVGYAGQNGHPYVAIGRDLVAMGEFTREEVSMQSIRAWLEAHPERAAELMNRNPSYVFFRELDGEGPIGAQGVPLTPGRSLAVDRSFVPYGVPVWLDAEDPLEPGRRVRRLMVAQDTGGAIRGPVRGDVFWGYGAEAELRAGKMKSRGRYFLLLPRSVAPAV
ncbi:MAG TPA: MltA domain-containing protein [Arenibaculum sp.]|nr:MltA domain-containing protein [Arenibaculum sp.]